MPTTLYEQSESLAHDVRILSAALDRTDQALARRLKRACDAVPVHVTEGMCSVGRDKRIEYESALACARETLACLRAAASITRPTCGSDEDLTDRAQQLVERLSSLGPSDHSAC